MADYALLGTTLGKHPLAMLRSTVASTALPAILGSGRASHGRQITIRFAGLVTLRQRRETAGGVTFVTLEDETVW